MLPMWLLQPPMWAAQPFGESAIIATAPDTSQPYAGDPIPNRHPTDSFNRLQRDNWGRSHRSSSCWCSSRSPSRGKQSHRSLSHSSCWNITSSNRPSLDCSQRSQRRSPHHRWRSATPYRHQVSHFKSSTPTPRQGKVSFTLTEHLVAIEHSTLPYN